jgi:hypothetical protein
MSGTIKTNAELIHEMKLGGELEYVALCHAYVLNRKGHILRNVRHSVAESVLNDMRFRHVNQRGNYIYMAVTHGT